MPESFLDAMRRTSHLSGGNVAYIESLYESYLEDPNSVASEWREYFEKLPRQSVAAHPDLPHGPIKTHFELIGRSRPAHGVRTVSGQTSDHESKQVRVLELISAFRHRGHKIAKLDPLGMMERPHMPNLELGYHRLTEADNETVFQTGSVFYGATQATLKEIVAAMRATYCGSLGAEYMHIVDASEQLWVQQRLEGVRSAPQYSHEQKRVIFERLTAAEGLERHLNARYPGTKRFGLEGAEAMIPMLHELLQRLGQHGVVETVIGMAHRGRLNVLINILGKHPKDLFAEFEGKSAEAKTGSGDVKYHQGFSSNVMTPGGEMHLALGFNPSHLEIVSPVVEGSVRARQDRRNDAEGNLVVPVLIHGDAAFAGQGVVMETFQMSQTRGHYTGGSIHIIINNQVGFTTSRQDDARSTEYCSEVAKMVQAPIFHVNGDDPEAVIFAIQVAADYRMQFHKDVVIDMVCYRRRGHNEAEEPMKTQPLMYQRIRKLPTAREVYAKRLIDEGVVTSEEIDASADAYRKALELDKHVALALVTAPNAQLHVDWRPYIGHHWTTPADTHFDMKRLQELGQKLQEVPQGFVVHPQVRRVLDDRRMMIAGAAPVNWGMAEVLAYATLLDQGMGVRLTGQDVGVGTFSHRHACLYNQKDGERYAALQHIGDRPFDIYDSLLSEEAALGFEYGYSTTRPTVLVIWEAQFGDFANGAQVVIDQFITSGEHKWERLCGLVMLLPHGFEGQGPEHSSARLERYLQMCAEHNIQVCVPTTPAQVFHMLRRQVLRPLRKPLVVMTPKSLLRHKLAVSTLDDLCSGEFRPVLAEIDAQDADQVRRFVMCSGKVYYDLLEKRREAGANDVAVVRLEQLYPFPEQELSAALAPYRNLTDVVWCQEEPMNQGAWYSSQHHMRRVILRHDETLYINYAGREASAAPAVGNLRVHLEQQERLIRDALFG